jgi:hypothetical protein
MDAFCDISDFEIVKDRTWSAIKRRNIFYAVSMYPDYSLLHRTIMSGRDLIDHINGNGLDNRRCNLRECTKSENGLNRGKPTGRRFSCKYKGVCFDKSRKNYVAYITRKGIRHHLGRFSNEVDATKAYNDAAAIIHGVFAIQNKFDS